MPPVIPLGELDGGNGFRLDGATAIDFTGFAISAAGDMNGDGIDDMIVSAFRADPNGSDSGASYVVFGSTAPFSPTLALASLNGSNGFRLDGVAEGDRAGYAVSAAGDINGDGLADILVGARDADASGSSSGSSYVVFGSTAAFPATVQLAALDGSNGFRISGAAADDISGKSVGAAGDINGDGIDDLIVGAEGADPNGSDSGSSYVVFGSTTAFTANLALTDLDGSNGFRLDGVAAGDYSGRSVSGAGDINGDGIDDLIVGAPGSDPNGSDSGSSYVVFGTTSPFPPTLALDGLNGSNGFRLDGASLQDNSGRSVSAAGDVNGDGIDDVIIGAPYAEATAGGFGYAYVVFGSTDPFAASMNLASLDGSNGFRIAPAMGIESLGLWVSGAGDVNGDGVDDVIVGAPFSDPNDISASGSSFVLFGSTTAFNPTLSLTSLDGSNGFRLDGAAGGDRSGYAVSNAGDINGDGFDDVMVGAPFTDVVANNAGSTYVVYGGRERIFRDGFEDQNIDEFHPRLDARATATGSAVRWHNGATCNCGIAPFDFNLFSNAGNLAFAWPALSVDGGVASGTVYSVLQPGAVIGPSSSFSTETSVAATTDWRSGTDGYLGFRFISANTGLINYGYARIRSTAPTGFPVKVVGFGVNLTGAAVTIPPD